MPYVYSTASAGVTFTSYRPFSKDMRPNIPDRKVAIAGGAGIANKHLMTPLGVATQVNEDELEILLANPVFQRMKKNGFLKISSKKAEIEKVVGGMETRDNSAPWVPNDYRAALSGAKPRGMKSEVA